MNDLILVGPKASGKTTFTEVLIQGTVPREHLSTISNGVPVKYKTGFLCFGNKYYILDSGGADNEVAQYDKWIKESNKIAFVFNGIELLEEVKKCENGGKITSLCRKICKMLDENKLGIPLYLIATHEDMYEGTKGLKSEIYDSLRDANDKYKEITSNNAQRYSFYSRMIGSLFTLDATNNDEVKHTFNSIVKEKY